LNGGKSCVFKANAGQYLVIFTQIKDLGVDVEFSPAYSPYRKPFVERAIGALKSFVKTLPGSTANAVSVDDVDIERGKRDHGIGRRIEPQHSDPTQRPGKRAREAYIAGCNLMSRIRSVAEVEDIRIELPARPACEQGSEHG
jgi:hypothetical protein